MIDPKTKGVSYGFAYISRPKGTNPEAVKELVDKKPKVEIDQKNCEFVPYLTPMYQDQTLVVKASDPGINHNVRLNAFTNPGLNQNVAAGGQLELKLVAERLPIKLNCDIHPWMKAYVMVFDHPFFTTTAKDGTLRDQGRAGRDSEPGDLAGEGRLCQSRHGAGHAGQCGRGRAWPTSARSSWIPKKAKSRRLRASP